MTDEDRAYKAVVEADVLPLLGGTEGSGPHLKLVESIVRQLKAVRKEERTEAWERSHAPMNGGGPCGPVKKRG
jgi:hypothetical protein